jgi:hypothetical protein
VSNGFGTLSAGNYDVYIVGHDHHTTSGWQNQPREILKLKLFNSLGVEVAQTNSTSDIPNNQDYNNYNSAVNLSMNILQDISKIEAWHGAYPDNSDPNSLIPVCALLNPSGPNLVIADFSVPSGVPGNSGTASVTVRNVGGQSTGSGFEIGFRDGSPSGAINCSNEEIGVPVAPLAPMESRVVPIPFTYPSSGSYTARVMADSDCDISELEGDNADSAPYSTISDYQINSDPPGIIATIVGSQNAISSPTRIYVTTSSGYDRNITLSSNIGTIPGLSGASASFRDPNTGNPDNVLSDNEYSEGVILTFRIPPTATPGLYTVLVKGNTNDGLPEHTASPVLNLNILIKDKGFREVLKPITDYFAGLNSLLSSAFAF